jgi:glycine/sarcosine N-methyltransferase
MTTAPFDDLTDVYEAMIDWPKRLANEEPFYRRLFERLGARSIADVACGTGRHAAMFHGWGLSVEGSDISPAMIERARSTFGEPDGLRWVIRGFEEPIRATEPVDVCVCVGNSLALAGDLAIVETAIRRMLEAVRDGGALVVHVLNLWKLRDGPCVWQRCVRTRLPQSEAIVVKGVARCGTRGFVHLVVVGLDGEPALFTESVPFLGLEAAELERMARRAGAGNVRFFGGYREQPYQPQESTDLLMAAQK